MAHTVDPAINIMAAGAQLASGAASASANIPTNLSGNVPTKIRVAATVAASVRLGVVGVVATAADTMIQPGDSLVLRVPLGVTKFAVIQVLAAGLVQVSPLES